MNLKIEIQTKNFGGTLKMINKELLKEIEAYCELNEVEVPKTINEALRSGFTILQYGMGPNTPKPKERVVEVIKEVIREVPVEKIVEKIIEVPVDRIIEVIKEVPVDKIIEIEKSININVDGHNVNYMDYIEELNNNNSKLEVEKKRIIKELNDSKSEIESINKAKSELQSEKEKLAKALKECKEDNSGYDIYGEK